MMTHKEMVLALLQKHGVAWTGDVASTGNIRCPFCDGGRHQEKSFIVYYSPDKTMYKCYRGTCSVGGSFRNVGSDGEPMFDKRVVKNIYTGSFDKLSDGERFYIAHKYHTLGLKDHLHVDGERGRLAVTLRDCYGIPWGVELKNWRGIKDIPKASRKYLSYQHTGNNVSWALADRTYKRRKHLFVTEDAISAYRIAEDCGQDAVALLGTQLRQPDCEKIMSLGYEWLRLVLDPDEAGTVGVRKIIHKYSFVFDRISAHILPDDPKNMTQDLLRECL